MIRSLYIIFTCLYFHVFCLELKKDGIKQGQELKNFRTGGFQFPNRIYQSFSPIEFIKTVNLFYFLFLSMFFSFKTLFWLIQSSSFFKNLHCLCCFLFQAIFLLLLFIYCVVENRCTLRHHSSVLSLQNRCLYVCLLLIFK